MNTDLDLDETVDESDLGAVAADLLMRVSTEHLRVGVVRDGEVVAVLIDPDDGQRFSLGTSIGSGSVTTG